MLAPSRLHLHQRASMSTNGAPSASPNHEGNTSDAAPGSKRKNPDGSDAPPTQQRAKRNRYISIACNECKRYRARAPTSIETLTRP